MADILDEVIKDHSDEKKIYYFRKIFPYIIAITSLIAIYIFISDNKQKKEQAAQEKLGDLFIAASTANDKLALEEISKNSTKLAQLASLRSITNEIDNGNIKAAKERLITLISKHNSYDEMTNAQIHLIWLKLIIDQAEVSDSDKKITNRCLTYFSDQATPLQGISRIYAALWYMKNQDLALAEGSLQAILTNTKLSENIKDQARLLLISIKNNG